MQAVLPYSLLLALVPRARDLYSLNPLYVHATYVVLMTTLQEIILGTLGAILGYLPISLLILITLLATTFVHLSIINLGAFFKVGIMQNE